MPDAVAWGIDLVISSFYLAAAVTMLGTAFVVIVALVSVRFCLQLLVLALLVAPCELAARLVPGAAPSLRRWAGERAALVRRGPDWWATWRRN